MDRAFIDDCVKSINDYRRVHEVAPLAHSAVVSTVAQRWADHMTRTGSLGHNPSASHNGQPLGENCAFKWYSDKRDITGMTAVHIGPVYAWDFVTDQFSGPANAIGPLCVCSYDNYRMK